MNLTIDQYQLAVGVFLPLLISVITKEKWSSAATAWIALGLIFLAAVGHVIVIGEFDKGNFAGTLIKIFVLCSSTYYGFWKPTGVAPAIERKINP